MKMPGFMARHLTKNKISRLPLPPLRHRGRRWGDKALVSEYSPIWSLKLRTPLPLERCTWLANYTCLCPYWAQASWKHHPSFRPGKIWERSDRPLSSLHLHQAHRLRRRGTKKSILQKTFSCFHLKNWDIWGASYGNPRRKSTNYHTFSSGVLLTSFNVPYFVTIQTVIRIE